MPWDLFISHASEDKVSVARPLAEKLRQQGFSVWIDETELFLGDSLRAKIDKGLSESRFGIVVISPAFLSKDWPQRELNGLAAGESVSQKVIIPIWHELDHDAVSKFSPMLADKLAVNTRLGMNSVVDAILLAIRADQRSTHHPGINIWPYQHVPTNVFEIITPNVTIERMVYLLGPPHRQGAPMAGALRSINLFNERMGNPQWTLSSAERQYSYKYDDAFVQVLSNDGAVISELMVISRDLKRPAKCPVFPIQSIVLGETALGSLLGTEDPEKDYSAKHYALYSRQYFGFPGGYLHYMFGTLEAPFVESPHDDRLNFAKVSLRVLDIPSFDWGQFT